MIYMLYGQPASGKTTLGKLLANHLGTSLIIDGDEFREILTNKNYSTAGRVENIKNANAVSTYLNKSHSVNVIVCLVNPYEHLRSELRKNNEGQVIEILLQSDRKLRKEHHVEDFEGGTPNHEINTDQDVEDSWIELKSILELSDEQKIICIGLPKTGTLSLCHALRKLGLSAKHGFGFGELRSEDVMKKLFNRTNAILEFYGQLDFEEIKKTFPDAKLIWTQRELEPWLTSCERQFSCSRKRKVSKNLERTRLKRFGQACFDKESFKEIFLNFNMKVENYKALHPLENILEMNIIKGDGYEKLCSFLDVPRPFLEFPHKNKTPQKSEESMTISAWSVQ